MFGIIALTVVGIMCLFIIILALSGNEFGTAIGYFFAFILVCITLIFLIFISPNHFINQINELQEEYTEISYFAPYVAEEEDIYRVFEMYKRIEEYNKNVTNMRKQYDDENDFFRSRIVGYNPYEVLDYYSEAIFEGVISND